MFTYIRYHYVHIGLLKFREIVQIYNCLFLYDYASDNKPCNFPSTSFPGFSPTRPMDRAGRREPSERG